MFVVRTSKPVEMGYFDRVTVSFRYTFYRPQTKRLRVRKIGLPVFYSALRASVALRAKAFSHPSGEVPCAIEDLAGGY